MNFTAHLYCNYADVCVRHIVSKYNTIQYIMFYLNVALCTAKFGYRYCHNVYVVCACND